MKSIFLLRHGETNSNLKRTWRTADEYLTQRGKLQGLQVADRIAELDIDHAVVSTASRAVQTAESISSKTGLEFVSNSLFYEEKSPTSIQGLSHDPTDPDNLIEQYIQAQLTHSEDVDWHFEDEENLHERKLRIEQMMDYFTHTPCTNMLVVTHGNIMKMIASYVTLGPECTAKNLYLTSCAFKTANAGITQLILESDGWRILTWNDYSHCVSN